jgi:hypothetical protein
MHHYYLMLISKKLLIKSEGDCFSTFITVQYANILAL